MTNEIDVLDAHDTVASIEELLTTYNGNDLTDMKVRSFYHQDSDGVHESGAEYKILSQRVRNLCALTMMAACGIGRAEDLTSQALQIAQSLILYNLHYDAPTLNRGEVVNMFADCNATLFRAFDHEGPKAEARSRIMRGALLKVAGALSDSYSTYNQGEKGFEEGLHDLLNVRSVA